MADNDIRLQHVSQGAASFSHGGESFASDKEGVITVPAEVAGHAKSHGFLPEVTASKAGKGGAGKPKADEAEGSSGDGDGNPAKEGASKAGKGAGK